MSRRRHRPDHAAIARRPVLVVEPPEMRRAADLLARLVLAADGDAPACPMCGGETGAAGAFSHSPGCGWEAIFSAAVDLRRVLGEGGQQP